MVGLVWLYGWDLVFFLVSVALLLPLVCSGRVGCTGVLVDFTIVGIRD